MTPTSSTCKQKPCYSHCFTVVLLFTTTRVVVSSVFWHWIQAFNAPFHSIAVFETPPRQAELPFCLTAGQRWRWMDTFLFHPWMKLMLGYSHTDPSTWLYSNICWIVFHPPPPSKKKNQILKSGGFLQMTFPDVWQMGRKCYAIDLFYLPKPMQRNSETRMSVQYFLWSKCHWQHF